MRQIHPDQIRRHRLRAHHLDQKAPPEALLAAAGACGLQNSPPGAWETALFNRLQGCTLPLLHRALYEDKALLQAWSYRGAPVVFPADQSGAFLDALAAQAGEEPWIYTQGIALALDALRLPFDDLLALVKAAAKCLDARTIRSKEALDKALAEEVEAELPAEKRALWRGPSMYGNPEKQSVGEAAVSFLLRPCALLSLVVFGRREGSSPTFTSFQRWMGRAPEAMPDADRALARKFLHCHGPSTPEDLGRWLGCSDRQALRLWSAAADEMEAVRVEGRRKTAYLLAADAEALSRARDEAGPGLLLLGAHDPYLDASDRTLLLEDKSLHRTVWKTVANPGAIVLNGRIIGIWSAKTVRGKLEASLRLWDRMDPYPPKALEDLVEAYAAFRSLGVRSFGLE